MPEGTQREKKVAAILSAQQPISKTQVWAFLGLVGYSRCFIPNFSSLASPLTDLTRKGQPEKVCWTPSAEEAFSQVKAALTSSPVLRAPDFSCPFLLQTDASDTGLGAVLSQIQEGEEHPIIYISRKLSPAERKYAAVEKEALAIRWAVLELRYYLLGRKFTLVTDHAPLQWMARAKDTNARVTRWFLALQDFHFEVRHRAGAANANADGLSRIWTAYAGLSGVIPHPPLISPLLSTCLRRTRTTLRGGGCDEHSQRNQRRPGNQTKTPARPRHRLIGHSCSPSASTLKSSTSCTEKRFSNRTRSWTNPSLLSPQKAASDRQPTPFGARLDTHFPLDWHRGARRAHGEHQPAESRSGHFTRHPSLFNKPTLRGF